MSQRGDEEEREGCAEREINDMVKRGARRERDRFGAEFRRGGEEGGRTRRATQQNGKEVVIKLIYISQQEVLKVFVETLLLTHGCRWKDWQ